MPAGKIISTLALHAGARHMHNVNEQTLMHLKTTQMKD
jgi:hypothetical protein